MGRHRTSISLFHIEQVKRTENLLTENFANPVIIAALDLIDLLEPKRTNEKDIHSENSNFYFYFKL